MKGPSRKMNLSEVAYNELKDALCAGKIVPGDILSENQLAERLGMSRTPVREALRTLASEGCVEIKTGIGAFVKPLSSKDMENLYEVRCLLEPQAARSAIYYITDAEVDEMERRFRKVLEDYSSGVSPDLRQFSNLDWELHELIIDRCQNNYIKSIMTNNTSNMKRYQYLSAEALNDIHESTVQHLHILDLIRDRNPDKLADYLRTHLEWAASFLTRRAM